MIFDMRFFTSGKQNLGTRGHSALKASILLGFAPSRVVTSRLKSINCVAYLDEEIVFGYAVPPGI